MPSHEESPKEGLQNPVLNRLAAHDLEEEERVVPWKILVQIVGLWFYGGDNYLDARQLRT